jgi:hypothetical protein
VRLSSPAFAATNGAGIDVEFAWYQRSRTNKFGEGATVQWSADGATWNDLAPFITREGPLGWERFRVTLPQAAMGDDSLQIGFEFLSNYGDNCYLDDMQIVRTDQLLAEGFNDAALPAGWSTTIVADPGTDPALEFVTSSEHETASSFEGYRYVSFNSWDCASGAELRLVSPAISAAGRTNVAVRFAWFQDVRTGYDGEGMTVQWSTNGTDWTSDAVFHSRKGASVGWTNATVSLPAAAAGQTNLQVGFLFHSQYGNNCYLDDVRIAADADARAARRRTVDSVCLRGNFEAVSASGKTRAGTLSTGPGSAARRLPIRPDRPAATAAADATCIRKPRAPRPAATPIWRPRSTSARPNRRGSGSSTTCSITRLRTWARSPWTFPPTAALLEHRRLSKSGAQQWKTNSMWGQATVDLAFCGRQATSSCVFAARPEPITAATWPSTPSAF